MRKLARQNPYKWNPKKVWEYTRDEIKKHKGDKKAQKRRYRARERGEIAEYVYKREPPAQLLRINWKEFVKYLKGFLRVYDGSKEQFADELYIHPTLLSHYLAGRKIPNGEIIGRIFEIFRDECPEDVPYLRKLIYNQP